MINAGETATTEGMSMGADPRDLLARALAETGTVVTAITPHQRDLATPCASWNVRELTNHLVIALRSFATVARGEPQTREEGDVTGEQWVSRYHDAADQLMRIWRQEDALQRTCHFVFGDIPAPAAIAVMTVEAVTHGMDLARATGQLDRLDPAIAEATLALARQITGPQARGDSERPRVPFSAELAAPKDASSHDRLAAFLGRPPFTPTDLSSPAA